MLFFNTYSMVYYPLIRPLYIYIYNIYIYIYIFIKINNSSPHLLIYPMTDFLASPGLSGEVQFETQRSRFSPSFNDGKHSYYGTISKIHS